MPPHLRRVPGFAVRAASVARSRGPAGGSLSLAAGSGGRSSPHSGVSSQPGRETAFSAAGGSLCPVCQELLVSVNALAVSLSQATAETPGHDRAAPLLRYDLWVRLAKSGRATGRGPAWLRRWSGGPESPGSNPGVPTRRFRVLAGLRSAAPGAGVLIRGATPGPPDPRTPGTPGTPGPLRARLRWWRPSRPPRPRFAARLGLLRGGFASQNVMARWGSGSGGSVTVVAKFLRLRSQGRELRPGASRLRSSRLGSTSCHLSLRTPLVTRRPSARN